MAITKPVSEEELVAKATAPRITLEALEANIVSEHYFTAYQGASAAILSQANHPVAASAGKAPPSDSEGGVVLPEALRLLTICVLVLRNGYTVLGLSACASPENFNQTIGQRLARADATNKIWGLMGYELRSRIQFHNTLTDQSLGESLTRMTAHSMGNPEVFRSEDANLILSYFEDTDHGEEGGETYAHS